MSFDFVSFNWYSLAAFLPLIIVCITAGVREHAKRDLILTGLVSLSLFLAASGMITLNAPKGICHLFLLDRSGSALPYTGQIKADFEKRLASAEEKGSSGDTAGLLIFGGNTVVSVPPCRLNLFRERIPAVLNSVSQNGTDLHEAVRAALSIVPEGYIPELTVIGDGTHQGNAVHVPPGTVYTYSVPARRGNDAALIGLSCPETVKTGEQFTVSMKVHAEESSSCILRIYNGSTGVILTAMPGRLNRGISRFECPLSFAQAGLQVVVGEVESVDDVYPDNDILKRTVTVRDASNFPILVVGNPLEGSETGIDTVAPSAFKAVSAEKLNSYSAVIINNVPYDDIGPEKDGVLRRYVTETGGGLMIAGTDSIFGPGNYGHTPLEEILPLSSKPRTPGKSPKRIMIAVDKSGSMNEPLGSGGGRKIDAAKAAALQFILDNEHEENMKIGLLFFSAEYEVVKKPSEKSPYSLLTEKLKSLTPYGGTKIIPALEQCMKILNQESEDEDEDIYIFIITDGITREKIPDADIDEIARSLKKEKFGLFTLKIGTQKAPMFKDVLKQISDRAGGDYDVLKEGENVVWKFIRGADKKTKDNFVREPSTGVFDFGAGLIGIGSPGETFSCRGYIRTSLQKGSIQIAKNRENDDPFAAVRYAGLGRTAALAGVRGSEARDISGKLLSWVRGSTDRSGYFLEIEDRNNGFALTLTSRNELPAGTGVSVHIITPEGKGVDIRLIRKQALQFSGTYSPASDREWFAYSVMVDTAVVLYGRYYLPYSSEYHPLYTQPVVFSESGQPMLRTGSARSYVPFIIGFFVVFMAYETVRGVQRMLKERRERAS